ncbi:hypothetical protein ASPWEDRAFT_171473 [Aspergillus wentii DTO 134E9]|uniref:Glycosyl hydrolase family 59 C-terminal lectin domain-containing protein n=1 Tax=Aspergillus wentii DTO 134E9 TaxID=1073089 RepID=A0A1L9RI76_ASPWE|nr:uncharacterized protein ASPWEDRAFT_171473 [Aspergillus wentii DTO 134E9]KAI9932405.1 hypothetical protein MW887_009918 [Aspergillus wentii]OJJ34629.1 hypothetical protein ASPWEDRAFT_171473 [Aspergillus wentii DTO 134E9]
MDQFLDYKTKNDAPKIHRSVFTNKDHGKGECPNLLPLSNGVIRYTTQSPQDAGFCSERTGEAPIGRLVDFGGDWSISGDQYSFTPTTDTAAVAVTGSSGWTDYEISADVMIWSKSGDVGLSTRVSALESGLNHLKMYTAVISSATGNLTVYQVSNTSTPLHSWVLPGGIEANKWYHLLFAVRSDSLTVTLSGSNHSYTATDETFPRGMAGFYGNNGSGGFKNVQIKNLS